MSAHLFCIRYDLFIGTYIIAGLPFITIRIIFITAWTIVMLMLMIILNHLPLTFFSSAIANSDFTLIQSVRGFPMEIECL